MNAARFRTATIPLALAVLLGALSGCANAAPQPADSPPPAPSSIDVAPSATATEPSTTAPATTAPSTTAPSSTEPPSTAPPSTEPPSTVAPESAGWATFEVGDGRTSWRMPQGWTAAIEQEVVEGRAEWTDYRGLVRDSAGTPMLRFEAIASGGQYATDFSPCERPETEVFEVTALGEQVVDPGAAVVALAFDDGHGGVTFAAGVSENDAEGACEPGILALYGEGAGYDYLLLQIVDDEGVSYPRFADFGAARAYVETDEYSTISAVLASFEHR